MQLNLLAGDQGQYRGQPFGGCDRDHPPRLPATGAAPTSPVGAAFTTDSLEASDSGMIKMTVVAMIVIDHVGLVYRSVSTVLLIPGHRGHQMGASET